MGTKKTFNLPTLDREQIHVNRTSDWEQIKTETCQKRQWNKFKRIEQPVWNKKRFILSKIHPENEIWQREQIYANETKNWQRE
jgi:hypothetical protein